MLIYAVCKCSFITSKRTLKSLKESLNNKGSLGLTKVKHSLWEYQRNSPCSVCKTTLFFTTKYSEKHLLTFIKNENGKILVKHYPNSPPHSLKLMEVY